MKLILYFFYHELDVLNEGVLMLDNDKHSSIIMEFSAGDTSTCQGLCLN